MLSWILDDLGLWAWVTFGLVLMGLELLVPGGFLIWLGLAAVTTGALTWAFGLAWQAAMLAFVGLSIGFALVGRRAMRGADEGRSAEAPYLNRRSEALVGRVFTLEAPIAGGEGRVRVGDSSWRVTGPDAPAGASVRVVGVDGATLMVVQA